MATPDKKGGTTPRYGSGENSRLKSSGYKLAYNPQSNGMPVSKRKEIMKEIMKSAPEPKKG